MEIFRARVGDSALLWHWRNDPQARGMFVNQQVVPWEAHETWFAARLSDTGCLLLIGRMALQPVGSARFDRDAAGAASISLNMAPEMRGRGLGKLLLQRACAFVGENGFATHFSASVKAGNMASIRLFRACGFDLAGEAEGMIQFQRNFASVVTEAEL